jgi:hypothetical protein
VSRNEETFDDIHRIVRKDKPKIEAGQFRLDLVGKRIEAVRFDDGWTILVLDNGQAVHILDESPWVWVDPEVM